VTEPVLQAGVSSLRGVGPAVASRLERIGVRTLLDLLLHLPARYQDRTRIVPLAALAPGMEAVVEGRIADSSVAFGKRRSWLLTVTDASSVVVFRFFHFNEAQRRSARTGMGVRAFGEARIGARGLELIHPEYTLFEADPPPLESSLTPVYPTTEGLTQRRLQSLISQALARLEAMEQANPSAAGAHPDVVHDLVRSLALLHRPSVDTSLDAIERARRTLAFDEIVANILVLKQRARAADRDRAIPLPRAGGLGATLLERLGFELTAAQRRVAREVLLDLERERPMLRLLQGDVGSGKTVIAAFAAIRAAEHRRQTAIMAPTEILAEQHYLNFSEWLTPLGIRVCLLTGRQPHAERAARLADVASGDALVVVGTHALFQGDVSFRDLVLVIVDEQHRFGVHQRMALRDKGADTRAQSRPHQLVMTATPIPRTLTMALYADMDVSVIDELPRGRQAITTTVLPTEARDRVLARVARACGAGRQVYWICPLIEESPTLELRAAESTATELAGALPTVRTALLHGRMPPRDKGRVMAEFKSGTVQLLVATTVVEVGIDVPNATLMVIENAERLGLAQLHQLRGRIGRGGHRSACVLLYQQPVGEVARKRLEVMSTTQDGFRLAEADLALRGPGDVLGPRQTGEQMFRVADLARDAALVPLASAKAIQMLDEDPDRADALVAFWSPGRQDYANV
jgi:ATP-dependent DNA helicase RecG